MISRLLSRRPVRRAVRACAICGALLFEPCAHFATAALGVVIPHMEGVVPQIAYAILSSPDVAE